MVKVKYHGMIATRSKHKEEEITITKDMSLIEFLRMLAKLKGILFERRLFHCGELEGDILIFINNVDYRLIGGLSAKITNSDELLILSFVHPG